MEVEVYCLYDQRGTDNESGTERSVTTKNNLKMIKARCAECGMMKAKLVSKKAAEWYALRLYVEEHRDTLPEL